MYNIKWSAYTLPMASLWNLSLLLTIGIAWGATPSLARVIGQSGASPVGLTLWQAIGGTILLLLIAIVRRCALPLDRAHLVFYLFCGVAGTVLPTSMIFTVAPNLPAGVLAMLLTTVPLMTYALGITCGIDRIAAGRLFGLVLGLGAVGLLFIPSGANEAIAPLRWIALALLIPATYSLENIFVALRRPSNTDSLTLLTGMMLMSAVILAPIVGVSDSYVPLHFPFGVVEWAMLAMILINVICYAVFLYLITATGPVFAAQAGYSVMIFGVAWGMYLFDERHTLWIWVAFALMLFGMALVRERPVAVEA